MQYLRNMQNSAIMTFCFTLCFVFNGHALGSSINLSDLQAAPGMVELADGTPAPDTLVLDRHWDGAVCSSTLTNKGGEAVAVARVVLFKIAHQFPPETGLYGEGFTMLSQTGGTLGAPVNIGGLTDAEHYKIPQPADATTVYNLLMLTPPASDAILLGFSSSRRFVGKFYIRPESIEVVLDMEGLKIEAGQTWKLEDFLFTSGKDSNKLLNGLAEQINDNHPRLKYDPIPTGWCSWYTYGPMVTKTQILANMKLAGDLGLPLKFIQIDDGYQAAMGDWLETGKAFGGGVQDVLQTIKAASYEPAIWVAPFVAEEKSQVFQEHPDWFIMDENGAPLRSDRVTFGGWRLGPWYALDGTHSAVQEHLEKVFRTMREEWGCTYFKLDANFWGAMHGGRFHDPKATRVEAYRRGMEAVLRGAGDAFILGCNHPLWPSLGLIHGSRNSGDITRNWSMFRHTALENFHRNWQNGNLWWNDPDCILLMGKLSEDEFKFHATAIYASGGMVLSGDNIKAIPKEHIEMLRKLLPPTGHAAQFTDNTFQVGVIQLEGVQRVCFFNWDEASKNISYTLPKESHARDFWSGEDLGDFTGTFELKDMPPHSARLIEFAAK